MDFVGNEIARPSLSLEASPAISDKNKAVREQQRDMAVKVFVAFWICGVAQMVRNDAKSML